MTREPDAASSRAKVRNELDAEPRLAWLLRRRVTVPHRPAGYLDRPELVERAMPTRNRLTVLMAPGGFGKSTLLAECSRQLADRGAHSLIREPCSLQRFRDARPRFQEVHRRIAVALARRGETLLAVRHAAESGDLELAGDIVEEEGGIRLWLCYGEGPQSAPVRGGVGGP